jgi:hypothetical protein
MQVVSQQAPPEQAKTIAGLLKSAMQKIQSISGAVTEKLTGITDEQFEKVCKNGCESFKGRCTDPVANKFPGKCDPILKFERDKTMIAEKPGVQANDLVPPIRSAES